MARWRLTKPIIGCLYTLGTREGRRHRYEFREDRYHPAVRGMVDDAVYDAKLKRIYVTGVPFINVFQKSDEGERYDLSARFQPPFTL